MSKVYTKKGDFGGTVLYTTGGTFKNVFKGDEVFEVLGKLDSLNIEIGSVKLSLDTEITKMKEEVSMFKSTTDKEDIISDLSRKIDLHGDIKEYLERLQSIMIQVSSYITNESLNHGDSLDHETKTLEEIIDSLDNILTPLKTFIIPGVTDAELSSHRARVSAREAERAVWKYLRSISNTPLENELSLQDGRVYIGKFLNRLSDFFFNLGRYLGDGQRYTKVLTS